MTSRIYHSSLFVFSFFIFATIYFSSRPLYAQHALMDAYTNAVRHGNVDEAKSYFDMGVSVDYVNEDDGKTPLLIACCRPDATKKLICDLPMIKLLVENGANVNAVTSDGRSALMLICETASNSTSIIEAAKYLVSHGANRKGTDKRRRSVLSYACCTIYHNCNSIIIKYLLDTNVNVNSLDNSKQTPLMWLAQCKPVYEDECLTSAKELLSKGANRNLKDKYGKTAKQIALKHGLKKLMKVI